MINSENLNWYLGRRGSYRTLGTKLQSDTSQTLKFSATSIKIPMCLVTLARDANFKYIYDILNFFYLKEIAEPFRKQVLLNATLAKYLVMNHKTAIRYQYK